MRDSELKKLISDNAVTPDYIKKDAFIRQHRSKKMPHVSTPGIILQQAGYMRKRVWIVPILMIIFAISRFYEANKALSLGMDYGQISEEILMSISLFSPILAVVGMIETFKAYYHNVYELEMVTVISARRALFARMAAAGIISFMTILICSGFIGTTMRISTLRIVVVTLIPYLLTVLLCTELERFDWARKNVFSCLLPVSVVIALMFVTYGGKNYVLLDMRTLLTVLFALILVQAFELRRIGMMEEYAWN